MPNFKKLARNYEKNAILTLQELVKIDSTFDPKTVSPNTPYGKGVDRALDALLKLSKEHGFKVEKTLNRCAEVSFGEQGPLVGVYAHLDVVPASGKWDYPPFGAKIEGEGKERKLYGRGASDDKGPLVAAYYAIKLLKDAGLIDGYRVRLVAGGDEERGSSCLESYFAEGKKEQADYGFTPDADFPLIYAEKAIIHGYLEKKVDLSPIVAIEGGSALNAVCDKVYVTLPKSDRLKKMFEADKTLGDYSEAGDIAIACFKGKSAHASTPELGVSAASKAFLALGEALDKPLLSKLGLLCGCHDGSLWGAASCSKELGKGTYCFGVIKYDSRQNLSISVDYRYGEGVDGETSTKKLADYAGMDFKSSSKTDCLLFDKKSPLVSTLMKSYRHMTHRYFDKPLAIGGGTYAKEAKNTVAYGSAFKGHPGDIHAPNEYIYISDFLAQIAIYADAIYRLGQLKENKGK